MKSQVAANGVPPRDVAMIPTASGAPVFTAAHSFEPGTSGIGALAFSNGPPLYA